MGWNADRANAESDFRNGIRNTNNTSNEYNSVYNSLHNQKKWEDALKSWADMIPNNAKENKPVDYSSMIGDDSWKPLHEEMVALAAKIRSQKLEDRNPADVKILDDYNRKNDRESTKAIIMVLLWVAGVGIGLYFIFLMIMNVLTLGRYH